MLNIKNAQKQYDTFSLQCSMHIKKGCISGLIGANGAGKSTTFKAILNLIKLDGGTIEIFGKSHDDLTTKERQKLGIALSDSMFSAYLNIKNIIQISHALYDDFDQEMFIKYCKKFDLPINKPIKQFSNGMKAKLKVLCAITHNAKLLILDEPTAGLDVIARDEVLDMLRNYMEEDESRSILISSHISSDLEHLCDDIYMIDDGKIIMHEDCDVLLSEYAILKVNQNQFDALDKQFILKYKKEAYGYCLLTNQMQYYQENYPDITLEKNNIDHLLMLMIRGEQI